jgi:hypothetical protein
LNHDFFKYCLIQGTKDFCHDRDYVEILLAFLLTYDKNTDEFLDCEKVTLSSSMAKSTSDKLSSNDLKTILEDASNTLRFMYEVFKGANYICKAADFCFMAIMAHEDEERVEEEISELGYNLLYSEYEKMWSYLEPSAFLNPLAYENIERVTHYLKTIISKLLDSKLFKI